MLTVNLGPLPVPVTMVLMLVALLVAAGVGRVAGRVQQIGIGSVLSDMLIAAMLAARVAFVAIWFETYRNAPWSMLDIRDGGFTPWAGIAAALLLATWRGWRQPRLRQPLILGLSAGALVWGFTLFITQRLTEKQSVPNVPLTTLTGTPADLAVLAAGKPMVVNLWATWCPPCRREMPVLAAAQKQELGVQFVFINQGENGATAQTYLTDGQLDLANVLLDSASSFGRAVGSGALPTTLFYDAKGRLSDTHLGQLSSASLANKLERLRHRPPD